MDSEVFALVDTSLFKKITLDTASALDCLNAFDGYKSFSEIIENQKK